MVHAQKLSTALLKRDVAKGRIAGHLPGDPTDCQQERWRYCRDYASPNWPVSIQPMRSIDQKSWAIRFET
jgi:hypothetical protein